MHFFSLNSSVRTLIFLCCLYSHCKVATAQKQQHYLFSYQVDSLLSIDSTLYKYQTAAVYATFTGAYSQALDIRAREYPQAKQTEATTQETALFAAYKPVDARQTILEAAKKTRIVIINEAHHVPQHRAYLTTLLKDLYLSGYTHLGMEALAFEDSSLNQRAYPVFASGYYTREPNFGLLIRNAIGQGYTLFPYEQVYTDSLQKSLGREKAQAVNIKKIIDKNPGAKFILYCGYDHAVEDSLHNAMGVPMAAWVKRMTGIDPFTVDQTRLTESVKLGSRYRQLVKGRRDYIFRDSAGALFHAASAPKAIDCNVYHPDTRLIEGRPHWMITKNRRLKDLRSKIRISYPVLVKVYLKSDNIETAIPLDIIELQNAADVRSLLLMRKKKHTVVCINPKGEKQLLTL
jgi:hypothetical protein